MEKRDRTFSKHIEELPVVKELDYGSRWMHMATHGTMARAKWSYDWNQVEYFWIFFVLEIAINISTCINKLILYQFILA